MKLSAFAFAMQIESEIESIDPDQYRMRKGRVGTLLEELYPLSRLALAMKMPGLHVDVEAHERTGRVDAHIWISGFQEREFAVEVTYAGYDYPDALRDEMLVQEGVVPGSGPIRRDKDSGKVVAEMAAENFDAPMDRLAISIRERLASKSAKPYPEGTVLLIAFEDMRLFGRGWWSMLFSKVDGLGCTDKGQFSQVYLFNRSTNELQAAA